MDSQRQRDEKDSGERPGVTTVPGGNRDNSLERLAEGSLFIYIYISYEKLCFSSMVFIQVIYIALYCAQCTAEGAGARRESI